MPELLFADIAQEAARTIAAAGAGRNNKSSQLRKFYDELVMWHDKVAFEKTADARAAKYRELAPFIKMMNAKVAYARGRGHRDSGIPQRQSSNADPPNQTQRQKSKRSRFGSGRQQDVGADDHSVARDGSGSVSGARWKCSVLSHTTLPDRSMVQ